MMSVVQLIVVSSHTNVASSEVDAYVNLRDVLSSLYRLPDAGLWRFGRGHDDPIFHADHSTHSGSLTIKQIAQC